MVECKLWLKKQKDLNVEDVIHHLKESRNLFIKMSHTRVICFAMGKKNISGTMAKTPDTDIFCGMVKVTSCGWAKSFAELNVPQCGLMIGTKNSS